MILQKEYKQAVKTIRSLGIIVADDYMVDDIKNTPRKSGAGVLGVVYYDYKKIYVRTEGMSKVDMLGTLYHEIIHTNSRCHNHGKYFKMYAEIVNNHMRKKYPNFCCGYHEKNQDNCAYLKTKNETSPFVIFDLKLNKVVRTFQTRSQNWKRVDNACKTNTSQGFYFEGGDTTSCIAMEKLGDTYRYYSRNEQKYVQVKNFKEI